MKVSLFNPFSAEYTALKEFPKLTLSQKIVTLALSVLAGLATFFMLGLGGVAVFRTLVSRFSVTPPERFTAPPLLESSEFKTNWVGKSRGEFFKYHLNKRLAPLGKGIAYAVDNGDCFFDSVAQTLTLATQKRVTVRDVRAKVAEFVEKLHQESPDNWVKEGARGSHDDAYDIFLERVGLTVDECKERNVVPVWGNALIAKIVAEAYGIQIRVHGLGTYDVDFDTLLELRTQHRDDEIYMVIERDMVAEVLFEDDENSMFGKEGAPLIEIACYTAGPTGHFYPVFNR
ncbi:hypothetical protein [Estrella lausannensis]|uniref:Cysteine protease n=1 Tax=Estrella lausannensis TaxID=483423 RepID=A0A0H5DRH3_9BACT|nr:hypothetical protein [Estrella lausannensis]CRX39187.1 Cysteine protease [Estrella lausannensis]